MYSICVLCVTVVISYDIAVANKRELKCSTFYLLKMYIYKLRKHNRNISVKYLFEK